MCLHAGFSAAHTSIAVGRVSLYPEWIYTTIVSVCLSKTVCTVWMCVCVYIWLYVGRWQGFVFTTSVLAVCACGFLHFTAASSTQPHRSCVFSLFHSVIVSIIKAVFAGRILSRQRITGSLNCWNGPASGSCVYAYARPCSGSDTASSLGLNSPEASSQVGTSQVLYLHC